MASAGSVDFRRPLVVSCDLCVVVLLMIALLAPLLVVPGTFFPYVVPRNILFRVAVELAVAIRILEVSLGRRRFDLAREYVLLALIGFLLAITVSALFSPARDHSFYGDFERMGGVWAWLHLVGFFLLLRTITERHFTWLLHLALAVAVGASLHALFESYTEEPALTIAGNAGLFAGYVLLSLAIALYLATRSSRYRWVYLLAGAIELCALLAAENRSSVLGLIAGGVVAASILGLGAGSGQKRWLPLGVAAGIIAVGLALIVVIRSVGVARMPFRIPAVLSRIATTDLYGADALRGFQWEAALAGFRDRPLFGFGIENHQLVWSAHFDPRSEQLGMDVFDRAHNYYLEILATTGILGTVAFLALWFAIGYSLYRAFAAGRLGVAELAIFAGANVAYATYLIFWFVDISAAITWLLVSALISDRCNSLPAFRESARRMSHPLALAVVLATGSVLAFTLHRHAYAPMRASVALATLDAYTGDAEHVTAAAIETIASSPARQTSHFAPVLSGFVRRSLGDWNSTAAGAMLRDEKLDRAFQAAITEFDAELRRDPLNDRLHTAAARLFIEAARFYDSAAYRARAIALLERAVELNPRRSEQRRVLASARADSSVVERPGN